MGVKWVSYKLVKYTEHYIHINRWVSINRNIVSGSENTQTEILNVSFLN